MSKMRRLHCDIGHGVVFRQQRLRQIALAEVAAL
jgi:hypothetical protein